MAASQQCLYFMTGSNFMQWEKVWECRPRLSAVVPAFTQITSSYDGDDDDDDDDDNDALSSQSHHKSVALLFLLLTLSCFSGPENCVSQSFLLDGGDVGQAGDVAMDTC